MATRTSTADRITELRAELDALMRDKALPVLEDAAKDVTAWVRGRPLTAVVIAAGIGYLLGRARHR